MEKEISPILIVNNKNLKPYIEVFHYQPENVVQQNLGILCGIFEIREYSEDSAYVVNFLNSVLKKEFYLNPRRPAQESFDCALNKVNLALSELVKHGNVKWLGKLDAAICVLEKNNLHFTATGGAKILLFRDTFLNEITEGLAIKDDKPNPMKTFINVSSGHLEKNDRLIITSDDLFNIFSIADLSKNLNRFVDEKFVQFLKTALTNELDVAGTILIDIFETKKIEQTKIKERALKKNSDDINVFSQKTFIKKIPSTTNSKNENIEPVPNKPDYTDKKTGHIYIQGELNNSEESGRFQEQIEIISEILANWIYQFKIFFKKQFFCLGKKIKKILTYNYASKIKLVKTKIDSIDLKPLKNKSHNFKEKIFIFFNQIFALILPHFKKIKKLFLKANLKQKIFIIIALISIIFLPLIFALQKTKKESAVPTSINQIEMSDQKTTYFEKYKNEKNIVFLENSKITKLSEILQAKKIFASENKLYVLGENEISILDLQKNDIWQKISYSSENNNLRSATFMPDLNLFFILTKKNELLSFSPISQEIKKNSITIPNEAQIKSISAYSTYLYFLDPKNNQIYRYPRTENGFGEKTNWLKEFVDLNLAQDIIINDNLFLAEKNKLTEFTQGKKTSFSFENSQTPLSFDQVKINKENSHIYALDRENSRLIKFDLNGKIIQQYHQEIFAISEDFALDNQNEKVYLILENKIIKLDLK